MGRGRATHRSTRRPTVPAPRPPHARRHPMNTRSRTLRNSGNNTSNFTPLVSVVDATAVDLANTTVVNVTAVDLANTTVVDTAPSDDMLDDDCDDKFHGEVRAYLDYSSDILKAQAEEVKMLRREVASVREEKAALKRQHEADTAAREEEYRCSICLELAWEPYVLPCGHSFCARCLSQHRINDFRTKARNPETPLVTCCPLCRAEVYQKPVFSCTIQKGVQLVAKEVGVVAPPPFKLRWPW
ncbi:hypothetical protein GG344DRAFT_81347 [Lentinula edodes]|nr:hypothetical protein GG344DRAFT_81347 [Lentinula edodes]